MDPLAELFARFARRGDVAALGEVFDRTAPRLLHLAMHLARSADDAEDLLQSTFVLAMRKADTFDAAQPLLPWLCGMLAGEAKNLARRNAHRTAEPLPDLASADGGPIASAERGELISRLRARVEDLPAEQRQALLLQLQHGLSPTDIAEVLDVPPGTVRMRLHRGLQALRRLLPSALAAWLFGAMGTRGLAAVRTAVLREASVVARAASLSGASGFAGAAAIAAGVLSMKYVFAGAAILLAAVLCWWFVQPEASPPLTAPRQDTAAVAAANATTVTAGAANERVAANETVAVPTGFPGSLRVQVTSAASGRPIADAAIRYWSGSDKISRDGTARLVRTDGGGIARTPALAPGQWQLEALGFRGEAATVHIEANVETSHTLAVAAVPLQGIVVDESDAPIAGASIRVGKTSDRSGLFGVDPARPDVPFVALVRTVATSASDGTFSCDAADGDGELYAAASHPQFTSSPTQLTNARLARWRFVLRPRTREVRGIVLDANRQPIAGATVDARVHGEAERSRDGTWLGPMLVEFATTGTDGRFEFLTLPRGNTQIQATASGYGLGSAWTAAPEDVEIVLNRATEIIGTVRDADGTPHRSGYVYACRSAKGEVLAMAFVDQGRFHIRELPPPPMTLLLFGRDSNVAHAAHEIASCDAGVVRVDLVVPARPTLVGTVLDPDGRPLANWMVAAFPPDARQREKFVYAETDADGRFALRNLRDDRVRVTATWPRGNEADPAITREDVSPHAGELVLRVPADRLPRASVAGRVLDSGGNPIAGTTLALALVDDPRIRHATASSRDGTFRIDALPDGDHTLLLDTGDGASRSLRSVRVPANEALELGEVRVLPLATLRIEATRTDGTPWRGMLPDVFLTEPDGRQRAWSPVVHEGVCEGALEPGTVRLKIDSPDVFASPLDVELLPGERRVVRIACGIGRSVSLVCAGDDPEQVKIDPKERLHLEVADHSGAIVLRQEGRRGRHGDGNWTIEHTFPFGEYTVTARTDSGRRYAGTFAATDTMASRRIDVPRQP